MGSLLLVATEMVSVVLIFGEGGGMAIDGRSWVSPSNISMHALR